MSEQADILRELLALADAGRPHAMAVVLSASGSTPRKAGTKAIVLAGGAIRGTIGGGAVEARAQQVAVEAIAAGRPTVFDFTFQAQSADQDVEPICGGAMRVLIDPTAAGHREAFAQAAEALQARRRGVLLTAVAPGTNPKVSVHWLADDAGKMGTGSAPFAVPVPFFPAAAPLIGERINDAVARQVAQLVTVPAGEILIEPVIPAPLLVIAGGGHVGQSLALQGSLVGFDVLVIDDRPEFTRADLFPPGTRTACGPIDGELAKAAAGGDVYVAIVTRGHQHDQAALAACIGRPLAYLGMIGSRRKVAMIKDALKAAGRATDEQLAALHSPIGLDIGAQTVPEIAVSIIAEMIAVRRHPQ